MGQFGTFILIEHGRLDFFFFFFLGGRGGGGWGVVGENCYHKSFQSFSCNPMRGVDEAGVRGTRHCLRPRRQPLTRRKFHSPSSLAELEELGFGIGFFLFFPFPFPFFSLFLSLWELYESWW